MVTLTAVTNTMVACTNGRRPAKASELWRMVEASAMQPDTVAYTAAITMYAREGNVSAALQLLRRMRREGVARDVVCYNACLHACAVRAGRWRTASRLRSLMAAEGLQPDDVTYSVLLQSLWWRPEATLVLEEAMQRKGPNIFRRCLRRDGSHWKLDLHSLSPGASVALAVWLLSQLVKMVLLESDRPLPARVELVTGRGKHTPVWRAGQTDTATVRCAVQNVLAALCVPILATEGQHDLHYAEAGRVRLDMMHMATWVRHAVASGLVRGCFQSTDVFLLHLAQPPSTILRGAAEPSEPAVRRAGAGRRKRSPA